MKLKTANKHNEDWSLQESIMFVNLFLDGVKQRDVNLVCENIAAKFERTFDAIKLRKQEVVSILSEGTKGLKREKQTKHMIEAVNYTLQSRGITKESMLYWFS